jgi:hypothetical protein
MNGFDKRKREIDDLRKLVQQDKIVGSISHEYFRYLRTRYPSHFISFVNEYKKKEIEQGKYGMLEELLMECVNKVNSFYKKFNEYLINPPQTEKDKTRFEDLVIKVEDLLIKQSKSN